MNTSVPDDVIVDSSVLVNFLAIDRIDLLTQHPQYHFSITSHVRGELTSTEQSERLASALDDGQFAEIEVARHDEVALFAHLTTILGIGESAAIAAASHRSMIVAVEDSVARRTAASYIGQQYVLNTAQLVVSQIQAGMLTVVQADDMKRKWANAHHFIVTQFSSFGEMLPPFSATA